MAKSSSKKSGTQVVEILIDVLSDTYVLMVKTHGYHWNVTGPFFSQLHALFNGQYEALFEAADELAERLRALDVPAPGSMEAFLENTSIREEQGQKLNDESMVADLVKSHEAVRERVLKGIETASDANDKGTEDLFIKRLQDHDKALWMLRAHLAD